MTFKILLQETNKYEALALDSVLKMLPALPVRLQPETQEHHKTHLYTNRAKETLDQASVCYWKDYLYDDICSKVISRYFYILVTFKKLPWSKIKGGDHYNRMVKKIYLKTFTLIF